MSQNEIPNNIKIYEYVINNTWLPENCYYESIQLIKDNCKTKNIEFIPQRQINIMLEAPPEDYIDTLWCIHCMTFIP